MSKITELKKQYPELNISVFDLFSKIDGTKTNKYLPLICNLLSSRFQPYKMWNKRDADSESKHITERVESFGINCEDMSINEIFMIYTLSDYFQHEDIRLLSLFRKYNERGLIPNNDVSSYQNFDQIRSSVGLATLKVDEKELKTQIIREHDDDTWIALRPLTFGASSKYGAATKWCTTYQNDKQYFKRYWDRGILVYFINKVTGLKFAVFKSLDSERELSFWNAADQRVDFLELEIDDYMFPIIKQILKSDKSNRDLSSAKIRNQVNRECVPHYEKEFVQEETDVVNGPMVNGPIVNRPMVEQTAQDFAITERGVIQLRRPLDGEIREELNNIMEEIGEDITQNLRESMGIRLENIEIGGAHQVGEEIGYEENCRDSGEM